LATHRHKIRRETTPYLVMEARHMRKNPTPHEKKLWSYIRSKKLGYKFRRKAIISGKVVDFYCPSQQLVIQIVADYYGKLKCTTLNSLTTLSILEEVIDKDIDTALKMITHRCNK